MNLRHFAPSLALALGLALVPHAHADAFFDHGTIPADDSVVQFGFGNSTLQNYTFSTTSVASGGFLPVLTLFNSTGTAIATSTEFGDSDVSFTDALDPGNYILALTEFPNGSADGTLADGFQFDGDPTITGDLCSLPGQMFIDDTTCGQRTNAYAVNATTSAVTPEPATWLLCLPPMLLFAYARRRRLL